MISSRNKKHASKKKNPAERVLAATAGRETWQTWAGRTHGTEDFEYLDVFRGMKRTFHDRFRSKRPVAGTTCPVCFCEPDPDPDDHSLSNWHVTWCGHGICRDCLGQYAASQVGDREQSGPLKCPVCLKTLREKDAIAALMAAENRTELIREWDLKTRNQLLRAIPSFRTCPRCGDNSGDGHENGNDNSNDNAIASSGFGGGFVTSECLAPRHYERRQAATRIAARRGKGLFVVLYFVLVKIIDWNKSPSARLDLFCMVLLLVVFVKMALAMEYWLASRAKQELLRPIGVGCPCCHQEFVLPAESSHLEDDETSRWLKANTRPCPSCSVPINKLSGCNHMTCTHCNARFCWACMRLLTNCAYYKCSNGAPYGSASLPIEGRNDDRRGRRAALVPPNGDFLLADLNSILERGRILCPELRPSFDGLLVLVCLFGRHLVFVQHLEETITPIVAGVFRTVWFFALTVSFFYFAGNSTRNRNRNSNARHQGDARGRRPRPNGLDRMTEALDQATLNEALRRSINET